MSIDTPNKKTFLAALFKKYGFDTLMNTVGVGMYNAAHMLAQAIAAAGFAETDKVRDALRGSTFAKAPQGSLTMQKEDHQAIVPSYLMKVRPGWTSVNDMFEQVQFFDAVKPAPAKCNLTRINREQGLTILIVEQNVPMVFRMTEHCVIIENGRIVAEGSRRELEATNAMKDYLAV